MNDNTNTRWSTNQLRNVTAVQLMQMRDDLKHHLRKKDSNIINDSTDDFYHLKDPDQISREEDLCWVQKVMQEKADVNRAAHEKLMADPQNKESK